MSAQTTKENTGGKMEHWLFSLLINLKGWEFRRGFCWLKELDICTHAHEQCQCPARGGTNTIFANLTNPWDRMAKVSKETSLQVLEIWFCISTSSRLVLTFFRPVNACLSFRCEFGDKQPKCLPFAVVRRGCVFCMDSFAVAAACLFKGLRGWNGWCRWQRTVLYGLSL